ncbi:MAG: hypothetical protein K9N48_06260, partial [Verrucomicrobia bacterium]|nr:hypothetical protein [Verrucomicrobiota bacterium]
YGGGMGGGMGGGGGSQVVQVDALGISNVTLTNELTSAQDLVRNFFDTAGVDLTAPKSVFFNDRTGVLLVRATMEDLEIIQKAIEVLNISPPQVSVEVKFVEVKQDDNKALGFDWFLGNTLMFGGKVGGQGGSAPSFVGEPSPANPSGVFPGPGSAVGVPGAAAAAPSASDGQLTSSLRNDAPALATITGILTDPQFRLVINAMERRDGVEVMSAPKVTTLSGRQAQVKMAVQRTILASSQVGASQVNTSQTTTTTTTGGANVNPVPLVQPTQMSITTGPTLDIVPYVCADGYTIQMTLIPSVIDFLGYGNPDIPEAQRFEASIQAQAGQARSPVPLPRFSVRQVVTSAIVWDGQTVVLGGLISEDIRRRRDKVPVLGDIPVVGRLFRSESSGTSKKNLVVFVTPTIIDPAGNRVHNEDNLPYDPNSVPSQDMEVGLR